MKQMIIILTLSIGLVAVAQEIPAVVAPVHPVVAAFGAIRAGDYALAKQRVSEIRDPASKLFVQACLERASGDLKAAVETAADLIASYPNDSTWIVKSELMIAALYMELDMLDAADVVARQIMVLHEGTGADVKAATIRTEIENIKKDLESNGSAQ